MNKPTIGVIGGGQLGKMLLESGIKWNLKFNVLESESSNSICNKLAHTIIRGNLHDKDKIRELADISDILTFELENIDVDVLVELENTGKKLSPDHIF